MFKSIKSVFKRSTGLLIATLTMAMMSVAASASTSPGLTTEMLEPLLDGVIANVGVVMPVALGIFAVMIGIFIIVPLIRRFIAR